MYFFCNHRLVSINLLNRLWLHTINQNKKRIKNQTWSSCCMERVSSFHSSCSRSILCVMYIKKNTTTSYQLIYTEQRLVYFQWILCVCVCVYQTWGSIQFIHNIYLALLFLIFSSPPNVLWVLGFISFILVVFSPSTDWTLLKYFFSLSLVFPLEPLLIILYMKKKNIRLFVFISNLIGILFLRIFIGILSNKKKQYANESWIFFLFACFKFSQSSFNSIFFPHTDWLDLILKNFWIKFFFSWPNKKKSQLTPSHFSLTFDSATKKTLRKKRIKNYRIISKEFYFWFYFLNSLIWMLTKKKYIRMWWHNNI